MERLTKIFALTFILLWFLLSIWSSKNLIQKNPETIFLTDQSLKSFQEFKIHSPQSRYIVGLKKFHSSINKNDQFIFEQNIKHIKNICKDSCQIITNKTNPNSQFIKLKTEKSLSFLLIEEEKKFLKKVIGQFHTKPYWSDLYLSGTPYINYLLDKYSNSIRNTLFPFAFAIAFLFIVFLTRNLKTSFFLFAPSLFSAFDALFIIKLFFNEMNMITSIIPLLNFSINLSLTFHLYYTLSGKNDFRTIWKIKKTPIILMLTTTSIGLLSLAISDIPVIRHFGILSSLCLIFSSIKTIIWFSCTFYLLKISKFSFKIPSKYFIKTLSLKSISLVLSLILIPGLYSLKNLTVLTDATQYFPSHARIKEKIVEVNKNVLGIPLFNILINTKSFNIDNFSKIERFETDFSEFLSKLSQKYQVLSMNSLIKEANLNYLGTSKLPDHTSSYIALRSQIPNSLKKSFPLKENYRLLILGYPINVDTYKNDLSLISQYFNKNLSFPYQINGLYYHLMLGQKAMMTTLAKSFFLCLFLISLFAFFYYKSWKIFFIFLTVNIFPVLLSLVFLYLFGLSLNLATIMTYSIGLGIIVDGSFHLVHYIFSSKNNFSNYVETIIRPILFSSILFIILFSLFAINSFLPIRQFGLNLSIILFFGLLFDLYVLPTLLINHSKIKDHFHENV